MLKKIVKLISSIMGIAIGCIVGKVLITLGIRQGIKVFVEPLYTGLIPSDYLSDCCLCCLMELILDFPKKHYRQ